MNETRNEFRPICMLKSRLALLYFPQSNTRTAVRRLMRWIDRSPSLTSELASTGYSPHQRILSHRQVVLITRHLGEP